MASEAALRAMVKAQLGPFGSLERVENKCNVGTPDICYALRWRGTTLQGWLELKHLAAWPARPATPTRLGIRPEQLLWAEAWCGTVHLLAQIGREYLLLPPGQLRRAHEGLPREELCRVALVVGQPFPTKALLEALAKAAAP